MIFYNTRMIEHFFQYNLIPTPFNVISLDTLGIVTEFYAH